MSDELDTLSQDEADDETLAAPSQPSSSSTTGTAGEGSGLTPGVIVAERYRIVNRLGKGGMGEVFRADDLKLDLPVALKFLPPELAANPEKHAELFAEVKVARQISHPNACRVYDLGEAEGVYFLSMEYIDGEDLKSLLRRIGRPPWDKSIELGRQMCEGLGAAHQAGVLHRDLKPANLMVDGEGRARITDFGLAALESSLSGSETLAGTPLYMAPEQFSGKPATVASDLYSLGLVLYELFTGRRVFDASSFAEVGKLHQRAIPTPPSKLRYGFDAGVEAMILRCLEKDPADRPGSVEEVSAALAEGLGGGVTEGAQVATLLASDLVAGTELVESLGDSSSGELFGLHDRLVRDLTQEHGGREIDKSGGFLLLFQRPLEALRYALAYHQRLEQLSREQSTELVARVGIHLGEVVVQRNSPQDVERGAKPLEIGGFARPMTARLMSLASGRQTLLSQGAFDVARRSARGELEGADALSWLAHGDYVFEDAEEPSAVFEVGAAGFAPLTPPEGVAGASRVEVEDTILGWRPAPGLPVPGRPNWIVQGKLGEGGFGETWLVTHGKSGENRVYKFCYEKELLFSLQREITVFRLLKEELGLRDDIARILDWNLDEAPYFLEFVYVEGGSSVDWAQTRGGIGQVPLAERLELVAQVADALAAAHSVGVLHKDIKPANVLVNDAEEGSSRAILTDFGIGMITDVQRLADKGITVLGMTQMDAATASASTAGTQLYLAPELLAGKAPTIQADIYALGVMLYQFAVGDLERPMPHGWKREIDDELLREDIADMVDGSPERRPGSATEVAQRLRTLEERRAARSAEIQRVADAERSQKRRRVLTIATAVSSVFLVVVSILAIQAMRARADAERRRVQAEKLIDFMLNDLHEGLDRIGRLDLLEGVARSSQAHFESLSDRDETPEALHQRGQTLQNIGGVLLDQGDAEAALASQHAAVELFEEAARREPEDERWSQGLNLARLRLGNALTEQGNPEAALESYGVALDEARQLAAARPGDRDREFAVAQGLYWMAFLQYEIGDMAAARAVAAEAIALLQRLTASSEADWRQLLLLIDSRLQLIRVYRFEDSIDEALAEAAQARELAERLVVEDLGNAAWPRRLAQIHREMASLSWMRGDFESALDSSEKARAAYLDLTVADPTRVEWRERLAFTTLLAGGMGAELGQPDDAFPRFRESVEILERLVATDPQRVGWLNQLSGVHQATGSLHLSLGQTSEAIASLETAIELVERIVSITGEDPGPRNLVSYNRMLLGDVYAKRNELDRARELWTQVVEWLEPITATSDSLNYLDTQVQAMLRLGQLEAARPLVEDLVARGWHDAGFLELVRSSGLDIELP